MHEQNVSKFTNEFSDDEYTDFSPNNMMKLTDFEPLSDVEQVEMDELLALSS